MSALKRKLCILSAVGSAALLASSIQANAVTLPDAVATVAVEIFSGPSGQQFSDSDNGTTSASASIGGSALSASGNISSLPAPNMSALLSGGTLVTEGAQATLSFGYYVRVAAPNGEQVPVALAILGSGLMTGSGYGFMEITLQPLDPVFFVGNGPGQLLAGACVPPAASNCAVLNNSPSFSLQSSLSLTTNIPYLVNLGMTITANALETESGSIDPMLTFDSALFDANGFQLELSAGVGNSSSETPLPATLPLFASGAGVLSWLGWRRKRKAVAAG